MFRKGQSLVHPRRFAPPPPAGDMLCELLRGFARSPASGGYVLRSSSRLREITRRRGNALPIAYCPLPTPPLPTPHSLLPIAHCPLPSRLPPSPYLRLTYDQAKSSLPGFRQHGLSARMGLPGTAPGPKRFHKICQVAKRRPTTPIARNHATRSTCNHSNRRNRPSPAFC